MPQQPIELILLRQLAGYLTMPVFVMDTEGQLLYYNEPAELLLGQRFDETGSMSITDLGKLFRVADPGGTAMAIDDMPIAIAVRKGKPAHGSMRIRSLDDVWRTIQVTAFPLQGQDKKPLGAVAMFWETKE